MSTEPTCEFTLNQAEHTMLTVFENECIQCDQKCEQDWYIQTLSDIASSHRASTSLMVFHSFHLPNFTYGLGEPVAYGRKTLAKGATWWDRTKDPGSWKQTS